MIFTTTDYILNLPETTQFVALPEDTQTKIHELCSEWPSFPLFDTHVVNGRKLIHCRMKYQLTEAELSDIYIQYGLDWQTEMIRSAYKINVIGQDANNIDILDYLITKPLDKSILLPFWNDIAEEVLGNIIYRPPTLLDTIYISTYAGTDPIMM